MDGLRCQMDVEQVPKSRRQVVTLRVVRRMPDGTLAILERPVVVKSKLTKADQHAQASAMMLRRLFDRASVQELAQEFGLEQATITRRLALARTDGVPDEARQIFIREMLPSAMAVVQEVMAGEDRKLAFQAAKLVLDGLEAMKTAPAAHGALGGPGDDDVYEIWREKVKITKRTDSAAVTHPRPPGSSRPEHAVIDGVCVSTSDSACPSAEDRAHADTLPLREGASDRS